MDRHKHGNKGIKSGCHVKNDEVLLLERSWVQVKKIKRPHDSFVSTAVQGLTKINSYLKKFTKIKITIMLKLKL